MVVVTDGDEIARQAVETAARKLRLRTISQSHGNPTPLTAAEIVSLLRQAPYDPVVVMVDDRGRAGKGKGERVLEGLARSGEVEILGIVAVASNCHRVSGTVVDLSVTQDGQLVSEAVDKKGHPTGSWRLLGDTVDVVEKLEIPVVIGLGDIGKMQGHDQSQAGAPITEQAIREILKRSGSL
ncbi:MAG: stage V sporulation protein AE [Bacillota bacterium]